MIDPFPGSSDKTTEQRINVLFRSLSSVQILGSDPLTPKSGFIWLNTTEGTLKVFDGSRTWSLKMD